MRLPPSHWKSACTQQPAQKLSSALITKSAFPHFPGDQRNYTRPPIAESKRHFHVLKHSIATHLLDTDAEFRFVQD